MPSMRCHECKKPSKCSMVTEMVNGERVISYLCAPCLRAYDNVDEGFFDQVVEEGGEG